MLCRATNALISVRLDYNNLRKKYRNFWFLFCSFILFFFFLFNCLYLSLSLFLPFSSPLLRPGTRPPYESLPAKRIAKICRAENGIIVRHIQINNITVQVKVIGDLFLFFFSLLLINFLFPSIMPLPIKWHVATAPQNIHFERGLFQNSSINEYFTLRLVSRLSIIYIICVII